MKKTIVSLIIASVIITGGCSSTDQTEMTGNTENVEEGYANVDVKEAKKLIEQGITIVDVRTPAEYAEGHIANATLIPVEEIEARINELSPDQKYLLVCRSGNRSAQASQILVDKGFSNIYNMTGGMNNWSGEVVTE